MMNQTSGARLSPIVILQIHESLSSVFVFIFSGCDSNQYLPRKEQREREKEKKKLGKVGSTAQRELPAAVLCVRSNHLISSFAMHHYSFQKRKHRLIKGQISGRKIFIRGLNARKIV